MCRAISLVFIYFNGLAPSANLLSLVEKVSGLLNKWESVSTEHMVVSWRCVKKI